MSKETHCLRAGEIITISSGEYSDYSVHGVFIVSEDFIPERERELYLNEKPKQRERYHFHEWEFISWLEQKGYIATIQTNEMHLDDYDGSISISGRDEE